MLSSYKYWQFKLTGKKKSYPKQCFLTQQEKIRYFKMFSKKSFHCWVTLENTYVSKWWDTRSYLMSDCLYNDTWSFQLFKLFHFVKLSLSLLFLNCLICFLYIWSPHASICELYYTKPHNIYLDLGFFRRIFCKFCNSSSSFFLCTILYYSSQLLIFLTITQAVSFPHTQDSLPCHSTHQAQQPTPCKYKQ